MNRKINLTKIIITNVTATLLVATAGVVSANNNGKLTIYFTRHAEKQTLTTPAINEGSMEARSYTGLDDNFNALPGEGTAPVIDKTKGKRLDEVCYKTKCAEVLSDKGELRAMLLADWFQQRDIARKLDAIYATHKVRTQQTVTPIAISSGLNVTIIEPASLDRDDEPMGELNPESTTPSECPTLTAIRDAQAEGLDTILIAGHSGTLYDIMGTGITDCTTGSGLGLDTGNDDRFPRDAAEKVRDFGDIWKIVVNRNGTARFVFRKQLNLTKLSVTESAR